MLERRPDRPQFTFCAGDDRTDEDMFRALEILCNESDADLEKESKDHVSEVAEDCFTCSIGSSSKKTLARYHLHSPEQMVSLLMRLAGLCKDRSVGLTM